VGGEQLSDKAVLCIGPGTWNILPRYSTFFSLENPTFHILTTKDIPHSTPHPTSRHLNQYCSSKNFKRLIFLIPCSKIFWRLNLIFPFFFEQNSNIPFHIFHVPGPICSNDKLHLLRKTYTILKSKTNQTTAPGVATTILKHSMIKIKWGNFFALTHFKTK
jgi:hypothetical protein